MKASLFVLSLLFFASSLRPSSATEETSAVLDTSGESLRTGVDYYILPVIRGRGGGVTMGEPRNATCPLDVVQEGMEVARGLPVQFSPWTGESGVIRVSTDLNFEFSAASICVQSTVWRLGAYDEEVGQWFVSTGGSGGNPGIETASNWFKIEKYDDDYKIVFCPSVCDVCRFVCMDVGIYVDGDVRRLALSDVPFKVMFVRAENAMLL